MKRQNNWNSFYTLNPVLPAAFLRALARQAGVHFFHDRDDTLYASRSFLTVSADGAGERRIRLPRLCDVFAPFTGEPLARGVTEFVRVLRDMETLLIRYSPASP